MTAATWSTAHEPASTHDLSEDTLQADAQGAPILIGGACHECGVRTFPRYAVCPACMSEDVRQEAMPRQGIVYSHSTLHVGDKRWRMPFSVGYVDLPNGVRVFSHLTEGAATIGARVEVDRAVVGQERDGALIETFVFKPAGA